MSDEPIKEPTTEQTGEQSSKGERAATEEKGEKVTSSDYSLQDAVDEAVEVHTEGEESKESQEEEPPKEKEPPKGEKTEEKAEEKKEEQELSKPAISNEDKQKIRFYDELMQNSNYQKQILESLAKSHNLKLVDPTQEKTIEPSSQDNEQQVKVQQFLNEMDPEARDAINHMQNQAIKPYEERIAKLEAHIQQQQEEAKARVEAQRKADFASFVTENQEAITKHQGELHNLMTNEFSGIKSKKGLQILLNSLTEKDRMQAEIDRHVTEAVQKALNRSAEVHEGVKRFSSVTTQQAKVHPGGGEKFDDIEAAFKAAEKELTSVI